MAITAQFRYATLYTGIRPPARPDQLIFTAMMSVPWAAAFLAGQIPARRASRIELMAVCAAF
jgi:hypothetical protein